VRKSAGEWRLTAGSRGLKEAALTAVLWPLPATQDHHALALPPLPPLGWGGEREEKGKTRGSGWGQFNRTANEANSNNSNTDKKNIQNSGTHAATLSHRSTPSGSRAANHLPPGQLPPSAPSMMAHGIEYPIC